MILSYLEAPSIKVALKEIGFTFLFFYALSISALSFYAPSKSALSRRCPPGVGLRLFGTHVAPPRIPPGPPRKFTDESSPRKFVRYRFQKGGAILSVRTAKHSCEVVLPKKKALWVDMFPTRWQKYDSRAPPKSSPGFCKKNQ